MADPNRNSYRLLWMLGAAMTVPAILLSGPIAGYIIGNFIARKFFHMPFWGVGVFIALGFVASAVQVYRLIKKINQFDKDQS